MNCRKSLPLIMLLVFINTFLAAQFKVEDIKSFVLQNGMKVIIWEDHSIPNANMYLFFKVGSRNESQGITGISHFCEHMMFNGAQKYGPKMFDRVLGMAGGNTDAYTAENITAYTDFFPARALETVFDLEADRIGHLTLDEQIMNNERDVLLSERSYLMDNDNYLVLEEQVRGVAFLAHPYRWSVVGYETDIKNWQRTDLLSYFKTNYAPNNSVAVIVGDITFKHVKELAIKYFEPIPAGTPPRPVHSVEPKQMGEKRFYYNKDASTPNIMIAYHVPETNSRDHYTLEMLNSILSSGPSSRLYSALVDQKQLAVEVRTVLDKALDPYLIYIYAVCGQGIAEETLENAIYEEIDKIKTQGITDEELLKVKNSKLMDFYRAMETINGKADNIGQYEIFMGDYKKLFSAPEEYQKVTVEDIKRTAATYFVKSNRTVGVLKKIEEK